MAKIEFRFPEATIKRLAESVTDRIFGSIDEFTQDSVRYQLLNNDTAEMITEAIKNLDEQNINRIELCIITARGQLYAQVKKQVFKNALDVIQREIRRLESEDKA